MCLSCPLEDTSDAGAGGIITVWAASPVLNALANHDDYVIPMPRLSPITR